MSEQEIGNEEREDIVNRPVNVVDVKSNKYKRKSKETHRIDETKVIDTSELDELMQTNELLKRLSKSTNIAIDATKRKQREEVYNKSSLDVAKKDEFKELLAKANMEKVRKPALIRSIFYENNIDLPELGFTDTEMAEAWLEYFGLKDRETLDHRKKKIRSWINAANEKLDAKIHKTRVKPKVSRYHITKRLVDNKIQIDMIGEMADKIDSGLKHRNRKAK